MTLIIENSGERAGIEGLWERYGSTPGSTEFMALAEQLRRRGCQGQAVEICTRAKASYPHYVSCRVLLGRCLMELGLRDEALRELEQVLELDRENAFSLRAMAELRMSQGNLSEAANYYRALVRINPSDLDMQQRLAQAVRALEPANDDATLPVGQEPAVRPAPGRAPGQETEVRPAVLGIEAAVEKALEELQAPEALVPAWHLEDQIAAVPASRRPFVTATRMSDESFGTAAPQEPPARKASTDARKPGRATVQFFNYANARSDFSLFARWVERERGGLGSKPGATNG